MENIRLAVKSVLSNYATFTGRASRPEFWWWVLAILLLSLVTQLIDALLIAPLTGFDRGAENAGQPLSMLVSLILLLPALAVSARRLHDIGRSAWWLLLYLVPLIGGLVLLWFYTRPSDGPNQWGPPNPLQAHA
jgi:uncharacterized membrane protein YhaH (DUF805 family)